MTSRELIEISKSILQENRSFVEQNVKPLRTEQLIWKPSETAWSIAEVLAHLNEYSNYYHPTFERKIKQTRFTSTKDSFVSSPLGRSAWKSMKLGNAMNVKRKFKAVKSYNPTLDPSLVTGNEIETYLSGADRMFVIVENASQVNLQRVKIPISIAKLIRLRLGDALLFVIYHDQRHIQQIKNILKNPEFPV